MKVILLQDVAKIGKRFETVDVPDGYALNMLIPKRMAEPATPENLKRVDARRTKAAAAAGATMEEYQTAVTALGVEPLTITAELNEQGHMFEALKPATIVAAAKERGLTLTEAMVVIPETIKEAGEHTVTLEYGGESAEVPVTIAK